MASPSTAAFLAARFAAAGDAAADRSAAELQVLRYGAVAMAQLGIDGATATARQAPRSLVMARCTGRVRLAGQRVGRA